MECGDMGQVSYVAVGVVRGLSDGAVLQWEWSEGLGDGAVLQWEWSEGLGDGAVLQWEWSEGGVMAQCCSGSGQRVG